MSSPLASIGRRVAVVAALAAFAAPARAQNVQFETHAPNPAVTAYGYYVGPFTGNLLGTTPKVIDLFCIDVMNEVHFGETWTATFSNLGGDLSNTRHGNTALDTYKKAAWLTTQYALNPTSQWGGIQAAAWALFNPGVVNGGAAQNTWLAAANAQDLSDFDLSGFTIVTDVRSAGLNVGGVQEFITTSVTPEPASLVLVATGLLSIVGVTARRRSRSTRA
jgi:hypothetical protein